EDIVLGDNGRATFGGNGAFAPGEDTAILSFSFNGGTDYEVTGTAGAGDARAGNWNNLDGDGPTIYGDHAGELLEFDDGLTAPGVTIEWGANLDSTSKHDPDNLQRETHSQVHP